MGLNIIQTFSGTDLLRIGMLHLSIYVETLYTALLRLDQIGFGSDKFGSERTRTESLGSDRIRIRKFRIGSGRICKSGQLSDCKYPIRSDAHV